MSGSNRYDVIVVGAGPAGGVAAYTLASAGCRVLLLEKEKIPRYKACGGGVTRRALSALPFPIPADLKIVEDCVWRIYLTCNLRKPFLIERDPPAILMTMRSALDEYIARKAVEAGATLRDQTALHAVAEERGSVYCETSAGSFPAQFLIATDGANSIVARKVSPFRPPKCGVALEVEIYPKDESLISSYAGRADFDFGVLPRGYGWVFPKADHLSAGVYTLKGRVPQIRGYYESYVQRKGLAEQIARAVVHGHLIPLGPPTHRLNSAQILLAGDAAGLADPLTGEGISYAVRSGRLAAQAVIRKLQSERESLDSYSEQVHKTLASEIRTASLLTRPIYCFPSLFYRWLTHKKIITDRLFDIFEGKTSYGEQLKKLVWKPYKMA